MSLGREGQSSFEIQVLEHAPESDIARLTNVGFGYGGVGKDAYLSDFAVWDPRVPVRNRSYITYRAAGRLEGCLGMREVKLRESGLRVMIVGAVTVDANRRGHGIATKLLQRAIQWGASREVDLLALWGEAKRLYLDQGLQLCGEQLRIVVERGPARRTLPPGFMIHGGWSPALFEIARAARKHGVELQPEDALVWGAHKTVDWWWLSQNGIPVAYAALGKGRDLPGVVHDWASVRKGGLGMVIRSILVSRPEVQVLAPAVMADAMLSELEGQPIKEVFQEYVCLAKVMNPAAVTAKLKLAQPLAWDVPLTDVFGPSANGTPSSLWFWGLDGG